ncbi:MAG: hypothetical protein K8W52_02350 [Deltaproteobacteria bacterium]|nr:hypothetical protein [Deltaproteobacteria bacterium]
MGKPMRFAAALLGAATVMLGIRATARAASNACVPQAIGVPTREGPPKWSDFFTDGDTRPAYFGQDEPRWLGASLESFSNGAARPPAQLKTLWSHEGASDYLYLSFTSNVVPNATMQGDVWLGFRRSAPYQNERAYLLQFDLPAAALAADQVAPAFCGSTYKCLSTPNWRVWVDRGNTNDYKTCDAGVIGTFPEFDPMTGPDENTPPFTWLNGPRASGAETNEDVMMWSKDGQWGVLARLKLAPSAGLPLSDGIDPSSTVWYEVSESLPSHDNPAEQPTFSPLAAWPRTTPNSVCVYANTDQDHHPEFVIHRDLGDEASWGLMSRLGAPGPAPTVPCDAGIEIGPVGAMTDPTINLFAGVTPGNGFKGYQADGTTVATNMLIAIARNTSNAPVTVPLRAHFRLAGWGSAPWSDATDTGVWKEIPGTEGGVCGVPPLSMDPVGTVCHPIDLQAAGAPFNQDKWAVTFPWQLGSEAAGGLSEFCKYGLTPNGGGCEECSCGTAPQICDRMTDPGTRAKMPGDANPRTCVSKKYQYDQCMLVELDAPNGDAHFTRHSTWNNMTFGQMSTDTREALIDTRTLAAPTDSDQQDIYLLVMPRNLPKTVPPGTTGMRFIRRAAIARAAEIAAPYVEDIQGMYSGDVYALAEQLGHYNWGGASYGGTQYGGYGEWPLAFGYDPDMAEQAGGIAWARAIMPSPTYEQVGNLLDIAAAAPDGELPAAKLTRDTVVAVGPSTAADLVPTLEVYPFYRASSADAKRPEYRPLTSFTVFLSHEGAFDSLGYEIDGAEKVAENVYHVGIPVGRARRLQFRSQAVTPGDAVQGGGDPDWPCEHHPFGCCEDKDCGTLAGVRNTLPLTVACAFVLRRKRRRPKG